MIGWNKLEFFLLTICFVLPFCANASVWITEVHYNPEGSDGGYEWIEVHNAGSEEILFTDYRFFEQGTNHKISVYENGEQILKPGTYGIVADKPEAFLQKYPEYRGALFDSAFSLKNTGEAIALINASGQTVFELSYDPATGGYGNGNSIGLIEDVWYEVEASPGEANIRAKYTEAPSDKDEKKEEDIDTSHQEVDKEEDKTIEDEVEVPVTYLELYDSYEAKKIRADAGNDRTLMAGASYHFVGKVYGLEGGIIKDPLVRWNWGDGSSDRGNQAVHRYRYPGEYTLTFSASVLKYSDVDRVAIKVIPPALEIVMHPDLAGVMGIHNNSQYHLELSRYRISVADSEDTGYSFPDHSYINAYNTMWLDSDILGFNLDGYSTLELIDGEDYLISSINQAKERLQAQVEAKKNTQEQGSGALSSADSDTEVLEQYGAQYPMVMGNTHSVSYVPIGQSSESTGIIESPKVEALSEIELPTMDGSQKASVFQASSSTNDISWEIYGMAFVIIGIAISYNYYRRGQIAFRKESYQLNDHSSTKDR
ncbi:MAG: lamin tail domain-containing protein [Patescibacteria group bacterium]